MTNPSDSPPPRKLSTLALIALGCLFATNAVSIDAPLVAIPGIASGFGVANGQAQLITSVFFLGFGLAQIPLGLISDRVGRRPVLFAGLVVMILCALLAALSPRFDLLVAARFVQGAATATTALIARAIVRDLTHGREAASMMSFLAGALAVMIFLMPLMAGVILWAMGWRAILFQLFAYGAVFAVLAYIYLPETISNDTKEQARAQNFFNQITDGFAAFFTAPASIAATAYALFAFCGYFMFLVMGASLMVDAYGYRPSAFTILFALVALMQWLAASVNRRFVERIGVEKMMRVTAIVFTLTCFMGLGLYLMPDLPLWIFVIGTCAFAFTHGLVFPNVMAIALEPHPRRAGIASSIYGTLVSIGTAMAGFFAGALYDGTPQTMFLLSTLSGGGAILIYLFMRRHLTEHVATPA